MGAPDHRIQPVLPWMRAALNEAIMVVRCPAELAGRVVNRRPRRAQPPDA